MLFIILSARNVCKYELCLNDEAMKANGNASAR